MIRLRSVELFAGTVIGFAFAGAFYLSWQSLRQLLFPDEDRKKGGKTPSPRRSTQSLQSPVHMHVLQAFDPANENYAAPVTAETTVNDNLTGQFDNSEEGQNLLNFLYNIAEDQARKDGYIHRGITCNSCNASPLCGVRYKCSNCVDYDICERCETQDCHNRTHIFIKIKIPLPPLANPRTPCLKPLYPGKKDVSQQLSWDDIQKYKKETHFDQVEIQALHEQYKVLLTDEKGITHEVFKQCLGPLGSQENLVMERMFKFYDKNGDGFIDFAEFLSSMSVLVKGSQEDKLEHAFRGYDLDNTGFITRENMRKMFKSYFHVSIELVRDVVRSCEEEMMVYFDDAADRPVSAVFNAPVPSNSGSSVTKPAAAPEDSEAVASQGSSNTWPVMEAMSQDAIDEMVENVFRNADVTGNGQISFEEFKVWASNDNTILAWFEALGTVF